MGTKKRVGALVVAIALIASACGGGSEVEAEQAALLEELEAQVEELTAEAEAAEQAAAEPIPEPSTTTTEAVVEEEAAVEPAEPEPAEEAAVEPDEESVAADEPAAELADDAPPAPVSGDVINSSMGPDQAAALMRSIVGPSGNLSGDMQRVDLDFPIISTLPDTEILTLSLGNDFDEFGDNGWRKTTRVDFVTSAAPEDALLVYQSEFAALFPDGRVSTSTQTQDDVVLNIATIDISNMIVTREVGNGVTLVQVTIGQQPASEAVIESLSGLNRFGLALGEPGATHTDTRLRHFGNDDITVQLQVRVNGTAEEFAAREVDIASAAGWTFVQEFGGSNLFMVPDAPEVFGNISSPGTASVVIGLTSNLGDRGEQVPVTTEYRYR